MRGWPAVEHGGLTHLVVDAECDHLGARGMHPVAHRCQPHELATAVRSPVAAVGHQQHGAVSSSLPENGLAGRRCGLVHRIPHNGVAVVARVSGRQQGSASPDLEARSESLSL